MFFYRVKKSFGEKGQKQKLLKIGKSENIYFGITQEKCKEKMTINFFKSKRRKQIEELQQKVELLERQLEDLTEYCKLVVNKKRPLSKFVGQKVWVSGIIVNQESIFRHNQQQLRLVLKPAYIEDIPVGHLNVFIVYDKLDPKMDFQTVHFQATVEKYKKPNSGGKPDFDYGILPAKKGFYVAKSNELAQKYKVPKFKKKKVRNELLENKRRQYDKI